MHESGRGSEQVEITKNKHLHSDFIGDTEAFYRKFFKDLPPFDEPRLQFRIAFLREEFEETLRAAITSDAEGVVDGCIDLMVVALGTLYEAGVDIDVAWRRVHLANMQKEKNSNPSRFGSAGFDLIKPQGWTPPYHGDNLGVLKDLV